MIFDIYTTVGSREYSPDDIAALREEIQSLAEREDEVLEGFALIEDEEEELGDEVSELGQQGDPDHEQLDSAKTELYLTQKRLRRIEGDAEALSDELIGLRLELGVAEGRGLEFTYMAGIGANETDIDELLRAGTLAREQSLITLCPAPAMADYPGHFKLNAHLITASLPGALRLLQVGTIKGLRHRLQFKDNPDKPAVARLVSERLREKGSDGYTFSSSAEIVVRADVAHRLTGRAYDYGPNAHAVEGSQMASVPPPPDNGTQEGAAPAQ